MGELMHPTVYSLFAEERIAGFRREAAADRLADLANGQHHRRWVATLAPTRVPDGRPERRPGPSPLPSPGWSHHPGQ
jgi:hypothetical protein